MSPRSMLTFRGSWMRASSVTLIPTIARFGSVGERTVSIVRSRISPPRRSRRATVSPGASGATTARSCATVFTGFPAAATITSPCSRTDAAGTSIATPSTSTPVGVVFDGVAGRLQRDGRRDLLGAVHVPERLDALLGE